MPENRLTLMVDRAIAKELNNHEIKNSAIGAVMFITMMIIGEFIRIQQDMSFLPWIQEAIEFILQCRVN